MHTTTLTRLEDCLVYISTNATAESFKQCSFADIDKVYKLLGTFITTRQPTSLDIPNEHLLDQQSIGDPLGRSNDDAPPVYLLAQELFQHVLSQEHEVRALVRGEPKALLADKIGKGLVDFARLHRGLPRDKLRAHLAMSHESSLFLGEGITMRTWGEREWAKRSKVVWTGKEEEEKAKERFLSEWRLLLSRGKKMLAVSRSYDGRLAAQMAAGREQEVEDCKLEGAIIPWMLFSYKKWRELPIQQTEAFVSLCMGSEKMRRAAEEYSRFWLECLGCYDGKESSVFDPVGDGHPKRARSKRQRPIGDEEVVATKRMARGVHLRAQENAQQLDGARRSDQVSSPGSPTTISRDLATESRAQMDIVRGQQQEREQPSYHSECPPPVNVGAAGVFNFDPLLPSAPFDFGQLLPSTPFNFGQLLPEWPDFQVS